MENQVNQKIIQSLERLSKAFRVLLWDESKKYGISPIQIQILLFCMSHKPEMLKVSLLAKEFDLTKATISDSVKSLFSKEMLIKVPDEKDSRSYQVQLTSKGEEIAKKTSSFTDSLNQSIERIPENEKGQLLNNLLNMIQSLNESAVISIQRMCLTCHYYSVNDGHHYCALLQKNLKDHELQIDCDDHKLE